MYKSVVSGLFFIHSRFMFLRICNHILYNFYHNLQIALSSSIASDTSQDTYSWRFLFVRCQVGDILDNPLGIIQRYSYFGWMFWRIKHLKREMATLVGIYIRIWLFWRILQNVTCWLIALANAKFKERCSYSPKKLCIYSYIWLLRTER